MDTYKKYKKYKKLYRNLSKQRGSALDEWDDWEDLVPAASPKSPQSPKSPSPLLSIPDKPISRPRPDPFSNIILSIYSTELLIKKNMPKENPIDCYDYDSNSLDTDLSGIYQYESNLDCYLKNTIEGKDMVYLKLNKQYKILELIRGGISYNYQSRKYNYLDSEGQILMSTSYKWPDLRNITYTPDCDWNYPIDVALHPGNYRPYRVNIQYYDSFIELYDLDHEDSLDDYKSTLENFMKSRRGDALYSVIGRGKGIELYEQYLHIYGVAKSAIPLYLQYYRNQIGPKTL